MSESFAMLDLLNTPFAPDHVVGWRDERAVRRDAFLAGVRAWHARFARSPGLNVALYFSDSIEFSCALFGAWHAGKTVYLPADALPATCTALAQVVDAFAGEFDAAWNPIAPEDADFASDPSAFPALSADFPGLMVYTSGSTGVPQAIPKKLAQLAAEVATLDQLFSPMLKGTKTEVAVVATVSHQHIYGLLFKVLWPLTTGRAIHAHSFAFPEQLAPVMAANACVLIASPAHLKRLPESSAWAGGARHLRAVFSSGGPLPLDVALSTAQLLGQHPIEVYGSSETGGIAWRRQTAASDRWTPLPGVEWRIDPDEDVLAVRSAHLPDADWFGLADRAQAVGDACFRLQGRVDRIVKIEEKRISLSAIEARLIVSPLVAEARVLVREGRSQRTAAFVILSAAGRERLAAAGKLALNRELRDALLDAIEAVALPRSWRYLDAFPVNAQGKITQAALLALLDVSDEPVLLPRRRLIEREPQRVVYEISAPADLHYFDGHFPGVPILAGVAQVDWVIRFGRECFALPPVFRGIHALKFQRVIRPEMAVTLELVHDTTKNSLTFRLSSAEGQHASGRILFGAADV